MNENQVDKVNALLERYGYDNMTYRINKINTTKIVEVLMYGINKNQVAIKSITFSYHDQELVFIETNGTSQHYSLIKKMEDLFK